MREPHQNLNEALVGYFAYFDGFPFPVFAGLDVRLQPLKKKVVPDGVDGLVPTSVDLAEEF